MRVLPFLCAIAALGLAACSDTTEPDGSTITLQSDRVTCSRTTSFEVTIDGEDRGSFQFSPGSEWTFPTTPGEHRVEAVGDEDSGFSTIERDIVVPEDGNFTILLTCQN